METNKTIVKGNLDRNLEEHNEIEIEVVSPPSTTIQGASSTKKINVIEARQHRM